jgi:flagellar basal body-associated protein FliL
MKNKPKLIIIIIIIIIIKIFIHAVYCLIMVNMSGTYTWSEFHHWEMWNLCNVHALWLVRFLQHIFLSRHTVREALL